jgi:hypothetical protein
MKGFIQGSRGARDTCPRSPSNAYEYGWPDRICHNTQNQLGNKAKTSAWHKGEHAAPSSPDSKSKKPTSTLFRTTVVRGPGQAGPEACPTRPSQHPNRRPIQEIIPPRQPNTQFAQGTSHKRGRNAPRACSLSVYIQNIRRRFNLAVYGRI